jgi:exodeoxyribonuclease X
MRLIVVDCETTGLNLDCEVVEVATVVLSDDSGALRPITTWSSLVKPLDPIPPMARVIHHISDEDVANAPTLAHAMLLASIAVEVGAGGVLAAHNAPFDSGFLSLDIPICTWRCSCHVWPEAPSHKNQVLRYWLPGLEQEIIASVADGDIAIDDWCLGMHRALPDAFVTAHLLRRLVAERSVDELVRLSKTPILHKTVGFGKHFGLLWSEVPKDYLRWLLRQDFDADTKHTAQFHLG